MPLATCNQCSHIFVQDAARSLTRCPDCGGPLRPATKEEALARCRNPEPEGAVLFRPLQWAVPMDPDTLIRRCAEATRVSERLRRQTQRTRDAARALRRQPR